MTPLEHFARDLEICEDGALAFRGTQIRAAHSEDNAKTRHWALTEAVYKHLYTHPDGDTKTAFQSLPPDPELIAQFTAANTKRSTRSSPCSKHSKSEKSENIRKFSQGQFLASPDHIPFRTDTPLAPLDLAGLDHMQDGFYHLFSQAELDSPDVPQMVRLYFNARLETAPDLVRLLSETLNHYNVVFTFKIATRPTDFSRADIGVLYFPQCMFDVAAMALSLSMPQLRPLLDRQTPYFTKTLAHGIGLAEDPGGPGSFGSQRSELVARALVTHAKTDPNLHTRSVPGAFQTTLAQVFANEGLDLKQPYLNPASRDVYTLPLVPSIQEMSAYAAL